MTGVESTSGPIAPRAIRIVPVGPVDPAVPSSLIEPLGLRFQAMVEVGQTIELQDDWFEPERGQYDADRILDVLVGEEAGSFWTLGLVEGDLFVPGMNYIFGEATVGGCCALVSSWRLRRDGVDPAKRFPRRLLTEAVHELGHVMGLGHCPDPDCVMSSSSTVDETDRKGPDFCARCHAFIHLEA